MFSCKIQGNNRKVAPGIVMCAHTQEFIIAIHAECSKSVDARSALEIDGVLQLRR